LPNSSDHLNGRICRKEWLGRVATLAPALLELFPAHAGMDLYGTHLG
jgi:hypothetical protein